jgi:flagella basal body P-ring formation protein FlgA
MLVRVVAFLSVLVFSITNSLAEEASLLLSMRSKAEVTSNVICLKDVIESSASQATSDRIYDVTLSPAPSLGNRQTWTRETVASLLELHGIEASTIAWSGADQCELVRVTTIAKEIDSAVVQASALLPRSQTTTNYIPLGPQNKTQSQSAQNAIIAIQGYLRSVSDSNFDYIVAVDIPTEGVPYLRNRAAITAVAGGQSPWIGDQTFSIQTKQRDETVNIDVVARVSMPTMIFAANRSLGKDHVISEADVNQTVLGKSSRAAPEDCFTSLSDLVGKQLTRTVSTGQPIERSHLQNPRVVNQNDEIEIQVTAPGLQVTTTGRAMQGGGLDDLILVEVIPQRTKLTARVVGPGIVSIHTN